MTDRKRHDDEKALAFCLFKYFPYGGLQRDMVHVAQACQSRSYSIDVYTGAWQGPVPRGFTVHTHRSIALTNHGRARHYHTWLTRQLARRGPVCTIGFNKMPGLDVYFAADNCFIERARRRRGSLYHRTPRYRVYAQFEAAVFSPESETEIILVAEPQRAIFQQYYHTPGQRLHALPPWISPDRNPPADRGPIRAAVRKALDIDTGDFLLLQVGSGYKTKGLDRSLRAVAALPGALRRRTRLAVIGRGAAWKYRLLAARLGVAGNILFLGQRNDVMDLMAAADVMVHPTRNEAAGVVLIEALVSSLPVVCSGVCGHSRHIRQAGAGIVLSEPFRQAELNRRLEEMLSDGLLAVCAEKARHHAESIDVHTMADRSADIIESVVRKKHARA